METNSLRILYVSLFFVALVTALLFLESPITGHVTAPIYSQATNIELRSNAEYELKSANNENIEFTSIRMSGEIIGNGKVEILIQDENENTLEIFSSSGKDEENTNLNAITGMVEEIYAVDPETGEILKLDENEINTQEDSKDVSEVKKEIIEEPTQGTTEEEPKTEQKQEEPTETEEESLEKTKEESETEEETTEEEPPLKAPESRDELNTEDVSLKIVSPTENEEVTGNFVLIIVGYKTVQDTSLALYIDNDLYLSMPLSSLEDSQEFFLDTSEYSAGTHKIKTIILAKDNTAIKEDSVDIRIKKEVEEVREIEENPPENGEVIPEGVDYKQRKISEEDIKQKEIDVKEFENDIVKEAAKEKKEEEEEREEVKEEPEKKVSDSSEEKTVVKEKVKKGKPLLIIKQIKMDEPPKEEPIGVQKVRKFTSVCSETCFLNSKQLFGNKYKLIINVERGTKLKIDKIIYGGLVSH